MTEAKSNTAKAEALANSRPIDVHRWSSHPESNQFVAAVFDAHFADWKPKITKKHLKVVLLDLYVAWADDPDLKISVSMSPNEYRAKSRYNAIHISKKTIDVVNRLAEADLIHMAIGFKNRETGVGRTTRIWPTKKLIKSFAEARFGPLDVGDHEGRETVILRDDEGNDIPYEDTTDTNRMRSVLLSYNNLLRHTFIDIPDLDRPIIQLAKNKSLIVGQHEKFVRRVFNRSSWDKGGRFFGGWWQRAPKEWRSKIFLDDQPTIEDDYSGLHIVMLYGWEGIDYWIKIGSDPYELPIPDFLSTLDQVRQYAKILLLMAINAESDKSAFRAFRYEMMGDPVARKLADENLSVLLRALRRKHPAIADYLGSGAGIDLMNQDAKITEKLVSKFTNAGIPILTIHDSYVVPFGQDGFLRNALGSAFSEVTGIRNVQIKREGVGLSQWEGIRFQDRSRYMVMLNQLSSQSNIERTNGYLHRLGGFKKWKEGQREKLQV